MKRNMDYHQGQLEMRMGEIPVQTKKLEQFEKKRKNGGDAAYVWKK